MADYYEVLGVPHDATDDEIRRAYRRKIAEAHPDKPNGDPERARLLDEARQALLNRATLEGYQRDIDELLDEGLDRLADIGALAFDQFSAKVHEQGRGLLSSVHKRIKSRFRAKRRA